MRSGTSHASWILVQSCARVFSCAVDPCDLQAKGGCSCPGRRRCQPSVPSLVPTAQSGSFRPHLQLPHSLGQALPRGLLLSLVLPLRSLLPRRLRVTLGSQRQHLLLRQRQLSCSRKSLSHLPRGRISSRERVGVQAPLRAGAGERLLTPACQTHFWTITRLSMM